MEILHEETICFDRITVFSDSHHNGRFINIRNLSDLWSRTIQDDRLVAYPLKLTVLVITASEFNFDFDSLLNPEFIWHPGKPLISKAHLVINLSPEQMLEQINDTDIKPFMAKFPQVDPVLIASNYVFLHEWRHLERCIKTGRKGINIKRCHQRCSLNCKGVCSKYFSEENSCEEFAQLEMEQMAKGRKKLLLKFSTPFISSVPLGQ